MPKNNKSVDTVPSDNNGYVDLEGWGRIPFRDAKEPMSLEISQEDIDKGECGNAQACVLACAARRRFGVLFDGVVVGKTVIHIIQNGMSIRFAPESKFRKVIDHFDKTKGQGKNGQGLWLLKAGESCTLEVPSITQKRGGRKNRRHMYGGKGGATQKIKGIMAAPTRVILRRVSNPITQQG